MVWISKLLGINSDGSHTMNLIIPEVAYGRLQTMMKKRGLQEIVSVIQEALVMMDFMDRWNDDGGRFEAIDKDNKHYDFRVIDIGLERSRSSMMDD